MFLDTNITSLYSVQYSVTEHVKMICCTNTHMLILLGRHLQPFDFLCYDLRVIVCLFVFFFLAMVFIFDLRVCPFCIFFLYFTVRLIVADVYQH